MEITFLLQSLYERVPATKSVVVLYLDRRKTSPPIVLGQEQVLIKIGLLAFIFDLMTSMLLYP